VEASFQKHVDRSQQMSCIQNTPLVTRVESFTVLGNPKPKGRARFSKRTGTAYTPETTRTAEETLAARTSAILSQRGLFTGQVWSTAPIVLVARFGLPIPESWPEWRKTAARSGELEHVSKPDIDNLEKLLMDALRGVLWKDDTQIAHKFTSKFYSENPSTYVEVKELVQATKAIRGQHHNGNGALERKAGGT
jgi:Holliday junction resolvase RusA-like endonuclease